MYSLIREAFPIARKKHTCIWCGESISIGEKYRHEISRYDVLQNFHWHLECEAAKNKDINEYGDEEFIAYGAERPPKDHRIDALLKAQP